MPEIVKTLPTKKAWIAGSKLHLTEVGFYNFIIYTEQHKQRLWSMWEAAKMDYYFIEIEIPDTDNRYNGLPF